MSHVVGLEFKSCGMTGSQLALTGRILLAFCMRLGEKAKPRKPSSDVQLASSWLFMAHVHARRRVGSGDRGRGVEGTAGTAVPATGWVHLHILHSEHLHKEISFGFFACCQTLSSAALRKALTEQSATASVHREPCWRGVRATAPS